MEQILRRLLFFVAYLTILSSLDCVALYCRRFDKESVILHGGGLELLQPRLRRLS
jgi:hypothetical protein